MEKSQLAALRTVQKFFPQVKEVVDALRPAVIEVTNKDASAKGIKDHNHCAMAVACKRKFHLDGVIISRSTAYLVKGKKARRFLVPTSVGREVVSFDRGAGFAPGRYTLAAISPSRRMGARQGSNKEGNGNGKPKRLKHLTANVRAVLGGEKPENE